MANRGSEVGDALLQVYARPDTLFVRGEGSELVDADGRRYLDLVSGIGVTALGHGSPVIRRAVEEALADGLVHTSNLFRTEPAEALARSLAEAAGLDRVFFCNSGAEAVEGAFKFARRWAREVGGAEKHRIVALRGSFHGRLFGSLAATDRPAFREPFEPLMPGVDFVDPEVPEDLDRALDPERTAALIVEPIQGEGGVRPLPDFLLRTIREWTRDRGIALVLDEVQCGLGRTGTLFAHESSGIRPDLVALAKPLAGGFPMGAVLLGREVADTVSPGDHATTFGGGPLVATVARAVLGTVGDPAFLEEVKEKGLHLAAGLEALRDSRPDRIQAVRGRGLMWGVQLTGPAAPIVEAARERGVLLVSAGPEVVRLLPPLTVSRKELDRGIEVLAECLA